MYPLFLIVSILLFLARWAINWIILNNQNQTKYSMFSLSKTFGKQYLGMMKHMAISEWTLYWKNKDKNSLKKISNILSLSTLIAIICAIFAFNMGK